MARPDDRSEVRCRSPRALEAPPSFRGVAERVYCDTSPGGAPDPTRFAGIRRGAL